MTTLEEYNNRHDSIKTKLTLIELPNGFGTSVCERIAQSLDVTGQTVRNYLSGTIKDGFLAEAIYKEFKRLKMTKT